MRRLKYIFPPISQNPRFVYTPPKKNPGPILRLWIILCIRLFEMELVYKKFNRVSVSVNIRPTLEIVVLTNLMSTIIGYTAGVSTSSLDHLVIVQRLNIKLPIS